MEPASSPPPPSALPLSGLLGSPFGDESRPRILVVDDDALIRQFLEDQLTGEGYLVSTARDGEEALAKVAADSPDLILLDVMMPKVDGFEVCRRLKSDERTILVPVVMVTALTATDQRIKGIEAGADDFLSKPYNRLALFTLVPSL